MIAEIMWNHTLVVSTNKISLNFMWNQNNVCFYVKTIWFCRKILSNHFTLYFISFSFTNFLWNWIFTQKFVLFSQIFCQIKTALPPINRDHFWNSDQFGFGFHWINIKNKLLLWNLWTHPLSLYWVWRPYTCKDSKTLPHPFSALWKSMILAESLNMGF